jgi:hypothetical protein
VIAQPVWAMQYWDGVSSVPHRVSTLYAPLRSAHAAASPAAVSVIVPSVATAPPSAIASGRSTGGAQPAAVAHTINRARENHVTRELDFIARCALHRSCRRAIPHERSPGPRARCALSVRSVCARCARTLPYASHSRRSAGCVVVLVARGPHVDPVLAQQSVQDIAAREAERTGGLRQVAVVLEQLRAQLFGGAFGRRG